MYRDLTDSQFLLYLAKRLKEHLLGTCDCDRLEKIAAKYTDKTFTLHWRDGKDSIVIGTDIKDAFSRGGYGAGAISALDHWEEMTDEQPSTRMAEPG